MPEIPVPQARLLDHTRSAAPLSQYGQLRYYDNGNAEALAAAGKMLDKGISVLAEFQRKSEETENRLSATEAQNFYTKLNADLDLRMAKNPGAFKEFEKWAKETDKAFEEGVKPFIDRMTPEFRKQFAAEMDGLRIRTTHQRIRTGTQAKVTADYNRFQTLFREAADNNPEEAVRILNQHRGTLISEEEFKTKLEIDLPRIQESAEARRLIDANAEGIIPFLEDKNKEGVYTNFTHIPAAKRTELLNYARAKDSRRRMEENLVMLDQMNSGKVFSRNDVETAFEGKTSPEDLRQKHEQIQMIDRFESNRKRAATAAKQEQLDNMIARDDFEIYSFRFSPDETVAKKEYADWKNKIITRYAGNTSAIDRLEKRLDANFKASSDFHNSYKNSTLFRAGENIIKAYKKEGKFFANTSNAFLWFDKEDKSVGTATLVEDMLTLDMDEFVRNHPNATVTQLTEELEKKITDYNKSTVAEIGEMAMARKGKGQIEVKKKSLPVGTERKGFIYQGGDPGDPKNWKKK